MRPLPAPLLLRPHALPFRPNAMMAGSLVPIAMADDEWFVFATLSAFATAGLRLGATRLGRAFSGPICAMALAFAAVGAGVLPAASPRVLHAQALAVRLATPMLLLRADLREVWRSAGQMLPAFLLGTAGTVLGTLGAIALLRPSLGGAFAAGEGAKVAWALAAKNIGGGINFFAVAGALRLSASTMAVALAVDNVMALVYFPMCSWLGRDERDPAAATPSSSGAPLEAALLRGECAGSSAATEQSACLTVALAVVAVSRQLARGSGHDIPLATLITVLLATALPRVFGRLAATGDQMGTLVLYLFFASAGWTGGALSSSFVASGRVLLHFLIALYSVHLALVGAVGALMRRHPSFQRFFSVPVLLVASNANIGGPATASALAVGSNWPSLVTPALLVGNLGYALATPLCLLLYSKSL